MTAHLMVFGGESAPEDAAGTTLITGVITRVKGAQDPEKVLCFLFSFFFLFF